MLALKNISITAYLNHCTFFLYILVPLQLAGPLGTFNSIVGYSSKGVFPLKVYTLLETLGVILLPSRLNRLLG